MFASHVMYQSAENGSMPLGGALPITPLSPTLGLGIPTLVALVLPAAPEACGTGIVPTTSTTMTLALGDALAVALMEHRRFTPEHFRTFHPGGKLGAQLRKVTEHGPDVGAHQQIDSLEAFQPELWGLPPFDA